MLKLHATFAAFFISLGRILWLSDDHSPKTWAFYAHHNPRTLPQTPVPLTLDHKDPSRVGGGTPLCSFLKVIQKGEPRSSSRDELQTIMRGSWEQSQSSVSKQRCSWAKGDLQCILQNHCICSSLKVQTKLTAFRMLSHCLHVKQSNQTFPSPFSLHVLLQTNGHELG